MRRVKSMETAYVSYVVLKKKKKKKKKKVSDKS